MPNHVVELFGQFFSGRVADIQTFGGEPAGRNNLASASRTPYHLAARKSHGL
jgi:hypothetical protein